MVRVGRLADSALQLRAALSEAGAVLLADARRVSRRRTRRSSPRGSGRRSSGVGLVLVTAACGRRWFDEDDAACSPARSPPPASATSRWRGWRCPICRSPSSSRWRSGRRSSRRSNASGIRGRWLLVAAAAAALRLPHEGSARPRHSRAGRRPGPADRAPVVQLRIIDVGARRCWSSCRSPLPWYVAMWMAHGTPYLEGFFVGDNFERFATSRFNDPRPVVVLSAGRRRRTAALDAARRGLARARLRSFSAAGGTSARSICGCCSGPLLPLVFFTLSVGKQPRYILPVLPPLALLLAGSIVERTRDWRSLDGARVRPRPNRAVRRRMRSVRGVLLIGARRAALSRAAALPRCAPTTTTDRRGGDRRSAGAIVVVVASRAPGAPRRRCWPSPLRSRSRCCRTARSSPPHDSTVCRMARHHGPQRATERRSDRDLQGVRPQPRLLHRPQADRSDSRRRTSSTGCRTTPTCAARHARRLMPTGWNANAACASSSSAALPYFDEGGSARRGRCCGPTPSRDLEEVVLVEGEARHPCAVSSLATVPAPRPTACRD